ncbi:MAG: NAD(P)-dependent oxidoreductase [Pseudonocardia sp.]|uniref:NAD(P)-dependent oxidoreductase n=1 Tax=unclassified Pseudonocardia TaxID=2619320 RepID=UPI000AECC43F|nr:MULTISPECIES: NAD(P)-dependent oxidoreductase [unclassified Pseudonocardia]MBN9110202.1 NAD(P)-dependent oxidoreductase [Pseudonocardia sp.]
MPTVGFVGLGNMGSGMAANLVSHGFDVVVHDVRREPIDRLRGLGAREASSPAELGARSDVVFVAAFGAEQVRSICLGEHGDDGLLAALSPGAIIVIHSTISTAVVRDVAARAEKYQIDVVDAAMTGGGHLAAEGGRLTFFVGGRSEAIERVRPQLEAMASQILPVGALGNGMLVKAISNFLSIGNTILVNEALQLAKGYDMDVTTVLSMVDHGRVGASWVSENWRDLQQQERTYTTEGGMADMARKDLALARECAALPGVRLSTLDFLADEVTSGLTRLLLGSNTPDGEL